MRFGCNSSPPKMCSNELVAINLFVSTLTGAFAWVAMVGGLFGMK